MTKYLPLFISFFFSLCFFSVTDGIETRASYNVAARPEYIQVIPTQAAHYVKRQESDSVATTSTPDDSNGSSSSSTSTTLTSTTTTTTPQTTTSTSTSTSSTSSSTSKTTTQPTTTSTRATLTSTSTSSPASILTTTTRPTTTQTRPITSVLISSTRVQKTSELITTATNPDGEITTFLVVVTQTEELNVLENGDIVLGSATVDGNIVVSVMDPNSQVSFITVSPQTASSTPSFNIYSIINIPLYAAMSSLLLFIL